MNVEDSTQTINFRNEDSSDTVVAASISLDFRYIALVKNGFLEIHCTSTGGDFRVEWPMWGVRFLPDGHDFLCISGDSGFLLTITQDHLDEIKSGIDVGDESLECPWGSSRGYTVTYEGWILGTGGKRMLMIPPLWRSLLTVERVWSGKFLALLHGTLLEPVILELEP